MKYEHKVLALDVQGGFDTRKIERALAPFGSSGWRLVAVQDNETGGSSKQLALFLERTVSG